jgi:ubiquinone/menaquinone biosynthesis C-methylase UbiE
MGLARPNRRAARGRQVAHSRRVVTQQAQTQQAREDDHDALDPIKREARAQWGHDPAGGLAAGNEPLGTRESFARVEAYRYAEQPWMHETFGYGRWAGRDVLEVGVGLGTDHLQFARSGARMSGVDLTPRCVEMTRRRLEQEGLTSDLSIMDAERLEFPDNSFDAVYSFGVLHHTSSPELAFREIRRVLRPGGIFLGGLYSKHSWFYLRIWAERILRLEFLRESLTDRLSRIEYSTSDAKPHVRLFTALELRATLQGAGFDVVRIQKRHVGLGRRSESLPGWIGALGGWYLIHEAR